MRPPLDEAGLKFWFDYYNTAAFDGRLPDTIVQYANIPSLGRCLAKRDVILISNCIRFSQALTQETLLHEMVHLSRRKFSWMRRMLRINPNHHGELFRWNIHSLVARGFYDGLL